MQATNGEEMDDSIRETMEHDASVCTVRELVQRWSSPDDWGVDSIHTSTLFELLSLAGVELDERPEP